MTEKKKTGFWKGITTEFKKIAWPSKKEVVNSTIAVFVSIVVISAIVALIDKGIIGLLDFII